MRKVKKNVEMAEQEMKNDLELVVLNTPYTPIYKENQQHVEPRASFRLHYEIKSNLLHQRMACFQFIWCEATLNDVHAGRIVHCSLSYTSKTAKMSKLVGIFHLKMKT